MQPLKMGFIIASLAVLAIGASFDPAAAKQQKLGAIDLGQCVCAGGAGTCTSKSDGKTFRSCYKEADDSCTGKCDMQKAKKGSIGGATINKGGAGAAP
ncbi:MAG: hypothetical protein ACOYB4_09460, partial [Methyloceanibacter sp.]